MHTRTWLVGWMVLLGCLAASGCKKAERSAAVIEAGPGANEVKGVIGKEGGTLRFPDTGARVEIPPQLLLEEVTVSFRREKPSFDLSGKDFVGMAYRLSPKLSFAPGAAKIFVPIDKEFAGNPAEINLQMYYYERLVTETGMQNPGFVHAWQVCPVVKFESLSQDQKLLVFDIFESISDPTTKPPFGLFQVGFDLQKT